MHSWILIATLIASPVHAQIAAPKSGVDCHTTFFGGTACVQQPSAAQLGSSRPVINPCRFGTNAAARLMCAIPKLAAMDSALTQLYRSVEQSAGLDSRAALLKGQRD